MPERYLALRTLLSDTRRLFPEERAELVAVIGRVLVLEKELGEPTGEPVGFPVLPRVRP